MRNTTRTLARRTLDRRLATLRPEGQWAAPPTGWIRAIRSALGMPARHLADRLGVRQQSIAALEKSEAEGTIQLNTLRRAAEALDCTLVYALVPRTSLDETVTMRARKVARAEFERIGHSMALEDQALSRAELDAQVEDYAARFVRERDLWD